MGYSLKQLEIENTEISSFYKLPFPKSFVFHPHYHPRVEIMYVESGDVTFRLYQNAERKESPREEHVKTGQYILFDSDVPHGFTCEEETIFYSLEFREAPQKTSFSDAFSSSFQTLFSECPALLSEMKKKGYAVYNDNGALQKSLSRFIELLKETNDPEFSGSYREKHYLYKVYFQEIFVLLCLNASMSRPSGIRYLTRINEYLRKNFLQDISLDDVAAYAGANKYYLEKLYKQHTGQTIRHALLALRMESAKDLLENSNLTVSEVAQKCGFNIRQQLIYNFKRFYGMTPSAYVAAHKEKFVDFMPDDKARKQTYDYILNP